MAALAKLSGYEIVQIKPAGYSPFRMLGLGDAINWAMPMVPLLRWLGFAAVVVLRPIAARQAPPGLSIVIPCRNEKGNIEAALRAAVVSRAGGNDLRRRPLLRRHVGRGAARAAEYGRA